MTISLSLSFVDGRILFWLSSLSFMHAYLHADVHFEAYNFVHKKRKIFFGGDDKEWKNDMQN